jgi:hypothetical protein
MDRLPFRKGAHFAYHGHPCVYSGVAANGRCQFSDGEGWMLEVPDQETGLPVWPYPAQVRDLMAEQRLILRADPLDDPVRRQARQEEQTRSELANAKCRSKPEQSRDPWYYFREETLKAWDDPDVERCSLTKAGIAEWYALNFSVANLEERFGRLPSDRTFRKWVQTRGTEGDRRPADFASYTSVGPRRRRIHPMVLAIIKHWAIRFHARPRQSVNGFHRRVTEDIDRYKRGEALEILNFERALDPPLNPETVKMCTRRIFTQEIERARGGKALAVAYGTRAREQRFGGGGVAQEPVRFLQYVQLDSTPFPMVFVFDAVRRLPIGMPTVTIALDVYTRVILGWDITFDPPSYASYLRTMLHTALPKKVPDCFDCAPETAADLAELCGKVVGHMLVDNAREQVGRAAQDAGGDIGFGVRWAGVKQPTHKGHVESCLGKLQEILRNRLPAGSWDIPLMREFDYNPKQHALVTLEQFREAFAATIARYHTKGHSGLLQRTPLDVWLEQRALHGLDWVTDADHFRRAVGEIAYVSFRGDGASIEGLRYGSDGSDERYPLSNDDLLFNLGLARGAATDAKKRTFDKVKIKYDPNDLSLAWIYDEHQREYVTIPCTMRRYSENLPLWLHTRLKDFASEKKLKFENERDMVAVRDAYARRMAEIMPEAVVAERSAAARYAQSSQGRAYLGNAVELVSIEPSPSGLETVIRHDDRVGTRRDANRIAPRSSNRSGKKEGSRDRRARPDPRSSTAEHELDQREAEIVRRLDIDLGSSGYR